MTSESRTYAKPVLPAAGALATAPLWERRIALVAALATALLTMTVIWAYPRPIGDLYVGLAGGRDVMEGKLAHPDKWSFLTTDRVWMNQNWGTHLAYYWANELGGQTGLLMLKAAMIGLMGLGIILAARRRGAGLGVSALVAGGVIIAAKAYIDLRPNLTTLMMAPWMLYLLMLSRGRINRIWLSVAFIALWANLHGGFNLGLGMLGLWTAYHGMALWGASGFPAAFKRYWPFAAATVAAIVLAGVATPFVVLKPYGLANLTHGFVVWRDAAWREVSEWRSLWEWEPRSFGSRWEFLTVLSLTAAASVVNLFLWRHRQLSGKAARFKPTAESVAFALFEATLILVVVYMACSSRRFMPAAMAILAPFLAAQLESLLRSTRRAWPLAAACLLLAVPTAWVGVRLVNFYNPHNPLYASETFMERQVFAHAMMPLAPAEFINANNIEGNVFEEWRWEGYLHWMCPKLKLYIGGRAQQVYSVEEYAERNRMVAIQGMAQKVFAQRDIHLVIMPWNDAVRTLVNDFVAAKSSTWAVIYFDGTNCILADSKYEPTRRLIDGVVANTLIWPTPEIGTLSRAACLTAVCLRGQVSPPEILRTVRRAVRETSAPLMPVLLANISARLADEDVRLMEERYAELSAQPQPRPQGHDVLFTCERICEVLTDYYNGTSRLALAKTWRSRGDEIAGRIEAMRLYWNLEN